MAVSMVMIVSLRVWEKHLHRAQGYNFTDQALAIVFNGYDV